MSHILPLRPAPPARSGVAALAARLLQAESAESRDEGMMDLLAEAEVWALTALIAAPARTPADVTLKLAAVVRRAEAVDGFLLEDDQRLLRSALVDLQRLIATAAARDAADGGDVGAVVSFSPGRPSRSS